MTKITSYGRGLRFRRHASIFAASWLVPLTLGFFSGTSHAAGSVTSGGVIMNSAGETLVIPDGTYTGEGASYIFNVSAGNIESTGSVTLQRGVSNVAEFVRANGSAAKALLNNVTIDPFTSSGSGTYGLHAGNGGDIVVSGLYKITGSGTVWGAVAGNSGTAGTVTLNDVDISITGGSGGGGLVTSTLASNILTTNGTVSINNGATSSYGVFVGQNSTINLWGDSNEITLSGTGSTGISLASNSTLNANHLVKITGTATNISALTVSGTNGKAIFDGGLTVNVTGTAVTASNGGTVNISGGGNITADGNGLYATGIGSSITANNLVLNVKGTGSVAAFASSGATVNLNGSNLSMEKSGQTVVANINNATINLINSNVINKATSSAEGLSAVNSAQINAENVRVSILGSGINAPVNNSSATTAVEVFGGGRINLLNSNLYTTANYAYGIRAFNSAPSTVYMRGGTIYTGISLNSDGNPVDRFGNPTSEPKQFVARGSVGSHGVFVQTGKVYLNVDPSTGLAAGTSSVVSTFGTSANGLYATGANSIIMADKTAVTTLSSSANGIVVDSGGTIGFSNSTITTSGNTAYGAYSIGAGSTITLDNATITTSGLNAHGVYAAVDGALIQMNRGDTKITVNGDATTSDPTTAGIIANSGGRITSAVGTTLEVTMNGSANGAYRPYGILNMGGRIQLDGTTKVITNGFNSFAVRGQGGDTFINGNLDITTEQGVGIQATSAGTNITLAGALNTINVSAKNGSISDGFLVSSGGTITVDSAQTHITTTGTNAHGIQLQTNTSSLNLNGEISIETNGEASHGFYLSGGAQRTIDGTTSGTGRLPTIVVHGENSAALAASGSGSLFTLTGTAALNMGMTDGTGTWGAKAETSGIITLTGNSSSGGVGLWASNGTLNLLDNANAAGSRVLLDTGATLNLQNGTTNTMVIGSLEGAVGNKVNLYGNTLSIGSNNGDDNGSLVTEANYAGSFGNSSTGSLLKTGTTTQILSGTGNTVGSVLVNGGTLNFQQAGSFVTTGDYTTASGGTTAIGQSSSTLTIGGVFTQESDSVLNVTLGAPPDITAKSAQLNGSLVVNGFVDSGSAPTTASDAMSLQYILLHTTDGITGDFVNNPLTSTGLDYLLHDGHLTNGNRDYELGFRLAWTEGGQNGGTGSFTINEGTAFDVDIVLSDQTIPSGGFASGWDGSSLEKNGLGRLVLSKENTYTGTTTVNRGILQTTIDNAFADSSDVIINTDGILDLDGTNQTANRLSNDGSDGGSITLNGGTLIVNNSSGNSTFSGVISDGNLTGGSFVHGGTSGTLILTGDNTYTGATINNAGTILQIGNGTTTGSLASSSISNAGTLIFNGNDDSVYEGTLSGIGELIKDGEGILTLSGTASSQSSVEVKGGTLKFNQTGPFTTTGDYTTASGGTTAIGQSSSTLVVGGTFTQESDSILNVTLGSSPDIIAQSAQLDGTLVVNGFSDSGDAPITASDAMSLQYILLHTTDGITGDFQNNPLISTNLDYLLHDGHVTNGGMDYELGFRLAWTQGLQSAGTGSFTMNEGTGFDVDVVLSDQTVPSGGFASGWDGSSLEKDGMGRLILSKANTYTGTTTVSGGTLALSGSGDISTSSSVTLNNSGTETPTTLDLSDLTTHGTTLNNLSGDEGTILNLGSGTALTIHTTQSSSYAGDFLVDSTPEASQLIKTGAEELILTGKTNWQGNTVINEGTLTLDGTNGGAQLVSNVVGQTGTTLQLIHEATLTGWIDPIDMQMGSSSTWTMTGDSILASQTFLDNTAHVIFAGGDGVQTFSKLTIGDLEGTGGFYTMRTNIAGNGAGSIGDLLEVTGSSEGNHNLDVKNSGSTAVSGTETLTIVKTEDGAATFGLTHKVEVGGYLYDLRRTAADNANWELYSTGRYTPVANASINAFTGGYLLNYGETQTLIQRMGDLRKTESEHGAWARIFGGKFDANGSNFLSGFDMTYSGIQVGYDQKISLKNEKGDLYIGGMFGYGKGNLDYTTGSGSIDSKTLGVYGTYIAPSGLYTDIVLKYGWMNHDFKVLDTAGDPVTGSDINTNGVSVSLEVGKKIHFNKEQKQGWYLEPQAQLSMGHQSGGHFMASNGLRVDVNSYTSTLGRLGMNMGYELKNGKNPVNIYGKVSYMHEFNGDIGFKMNGIENQQTFSDSWWTYGIGITAQINKKHNVFLDIERASGGKFTQPWSVNGGYRFNW